MSLFANSVVGECEYPPDDDTFKSKDHPIECVRCERVVLAIEEWLIDPTDEQAVMYIYFD